MPASFGKRLKEIRENNGLSQSQLATMLGISRPTLTQIESDKRTIKTSELATLAKIFDISTDFLLSGETLKKISITHKQKTVFKHLILYILSKVGGKYNVGKTVLYKLLYFAEFDYFELYNKYISGYPFIKLPMGPAPRYFNELVQEMERHNDIASVTTQYHNYYQQRFLANKPIQQNIFTQEQKQLIDEVLERYSDLSATEISNESHKDTPWQMAQDMTTIPYEHVKFRTYPFSPIARNNKKQKAEQFARMTSFFDDLADEPDLYEDYR